MNSSADNAYYALQKSEPIKGLRHEGSNFKRKGKIPKTGIDVSNADDKYYRLAQDAFDTTTKQKVSNLVITESNINAIPSLVSDLLKSSTKVVVNCDPSLVRQAMTKLQLSIGQLVLTEEQLLCVTFIAPTTDLAVTTEQPKPDVTPVAEESKPEAISVTEEPKAEEPKAEEPKPDVAAVTEEPKAEEPKVEDQND